MSGRYLHLGTDDLLTAVGYLPIGVSIMDRSLRIVYWNDAFLELLDFPESLLVAHTGIGDLFRYNAERGDYGPGDPDTQVRERLALVERFEPHHFTRTRKDGRILDIRGRTIGDADGHVTGIVTLYQDITAEKTYELQLEASNRELQEALLNLKRAQIQLVQTEKLASVGQLAAGVAHEINNPIGFVHSNLGALDRYIGLIFRLLDAYGRLEEKVAQQPETLAEARALKAQIDLAFLKEDIPTLVQESRDGLLRVQKIVQDLREFSRVSDDNRWQPWDLNRCLGSAINLVLGAAPKPGALHRELAALPEIPCLPAQLNQVFLNLMTNAAQAVAPEGGVITVRSGQTADEVWVEVADNGCGIPADVLPRIFDPFFTTRPVGQGSGLGLSMSYGVVRGHGGRIEVNSEPGLGSAFRVWLPKTRRAPEPAAGRSGDAD